MFLPILLILIGSFWLLRNLGVLPAEAGNYFWPLVVIALGISMLVEKRKWWSWHCRPLFKKEKKKGN